MLTVNKNVPVRRGLHDDLFRVYIVIGGTGPNAGRIKTEYFTTNKEPSIAKVQWGHKNGRRARIKSIELDSDLRAQGWMLLEEEFKKEGLDHEWGQFLAFQDACRSGRVHIADPKKVRNDPCPGFPTDMLPRSVQNLHNRTVAKAWRWAPERKPEADMGEGDGLDGDDELEEKLPDSSRKGDGAAARAPIKRRRQAV